MGPALTYARRYALFTLVGIAGEDDLDAPDLQAPAAQKQGPEQAAAQGHESGVSARPGLCGPFFSCRLRSRTPGTPPFFGNRDIFNKNREGDKARKGNY